MNLNSSPLLDVRDLACERDDARLFQQLSFQLKPGELLQIAGPNGVGKTSLLRLLCGLSYPAAGEIRHSDSSTDWVYLGHQNGLKPALNALENLRWWLQLRGDNPHDDALFAVLARVGLSGYERLPCYSLSAGQQRRVALARLLIAKARLWILDEPFNALDVAATQELIGWLREFVSSGGAVIYTSHVQLPDLATRVLDLQTYSMKYAA